MVDNIKEIKAVKEILEDYNGDVGRWAIDKEKEIKRFRGIDFNRDKAERLQRMQELCKRLYELDKRITNVFVPFDKTCINASVSIVLPAVYSSSEERIIECLSELFEEADDVFFSALSGDVKMSFSILDMWSEYKYLD